MSNVFEADPIGLGMLVVAIAAGIGVYALVFFVGLEDGLRRRRSPSQVQLEAAGCGLLVTAAVGMLATWNWLVFVALAFVAFLLLLSGRGMHRSTVVIVLAALAIGVALTLMHGLGKSKHTTPAHAPPANSAPAGSNSLIGAPGVDDQLNNEAPAGNTASNGLI